MKANEFSENTKFNELRQRLMSAANDATYYYQQPEKVSSDKRSRLDAVINELKTFVSELQIPIITASQFNKDAESVMNKDYRSFVEGQSVKDIVEEVVELNKFIDKYDKIVLKDVPVIWCVYFIKYMHEFTKNAIYDISNLAEIYKGGTGKEDLVLSAPFKRGDKYNALIDFESEKVSICDVYNFIINIIDILDIMFNDDTLKELTILGINDVSDIEIWFTPFCSTDKIKTIEISDGNKISYDDLSRFRFEFITSIFESKLKGWDTV